MISCLLLNLLLLHTLAYSHPYPIKQGDVSERLIVIIIIIIIMIIIIKQEGDVSERREPTNCNSLCRRLLCLSASCLSPHAECRMPAILDSSV